MRARCLTYLESFEVAWGELSALLPQIKDGRLAARVAVDLVHLAYYLLHGDEVPRLAKIVEKRAAGDPLMMAELRHGRSANLTAANNVTGALRDARFAEDAVRAAPRGRSRDLVAMRVQRQLAYLLSHAADYMGARAAADATARYAARMSDPWELAWATCTSGFVASYAGQTDRAVEELTRGEAALRRYGSSLWRFALFSLGRVRLERGELADGDRLARQSGTGAAEDHAHLALLRGEAGVAERILTQAPRGLPADEHFRDLVRGLVRAARGDPRVGVKMIDDAGSEFESRGMAHWAIGAAVHAAYWRQHIARGAGASRAARLVRDISARGGEGFAYYLPEVAAWLGREAERDPQARTLARTVRIRGETAMRRAKADASAQLAPSALDEATFHLRSLGLTWRELEVLRAVERQRGESKRTDRDSLAKALGVSPNTLRVHLTRIRAKLDVSERRGDEVLLDAALGQGRAS